MAYIIAEPCINTKDTACVDVCPVDCIHPRKDEANFADLPQLYIDPVECIDCGACVPVCPVSAIFPLDDLPEKWSSFTETNAEYYEKQFRSPPASLRRMSPLPSELQRLDCSPITVGDRQEQPQGLPCNRLVLLKIAPVFAFPVDRSLTTK